MATNSEEQMSDLFDEIDDLLDFLNEEENALVMVKKPCNETGAFLLPPLTPPPAAFPGGGGEGDSLECSSDQKQVRFLVFLFYVPFEVLIVVLLFIVRREIGLLDAGVPRRM